MLFLRGETGIGKSALCRYAIEQAQGMIVLASRGVESEGELPYAALDDLDDRPRRGSADMSRNLSRKTATAWS